MIAVERQSKIRDLLLENKSVKVSDLVQLFNVSEETIRRDLHKFENEGLVKKIYGGAVLLDKQVTNEDVLPIYQRKNQFFEEKRLIGQAASQLVKKDQTIIVDAGSTTWHLANNLLSVDNLMIVTNAINIAEECSKNETNTVYLLGGKVRRNSISTVSPHSETELNQYNAKYVFLGSSGISLRYGCTSSDLYEADMKREMVKAAEKRVVVADHSKFERVGLTSFCGFEDIDILITSDKVKQHILKEIEKLGVEVIAVST